MNFLKRTFVAILAMTLSLTFGFTAFSQTNDNDVDFDDITDDGNYLKNVTNIRILTLGDSFTVGDTTRGAYRYYLHEKFLGDGINFTFVGPKVSRDFRLSSRYNRHLGNGGHTLTQINQNFLNFVSANPNSFDVVIVMGGGNDILKKDGTTEDHVERYRTILSNIYKANPQAIVYVAKQPLDEVEVLNQRLPSICEEFETAGYEIYCVDANVLKKGTDDYGAKGNIHPSEKGQQKIANALYDAMASRMIGLNNGAFDNTFVNVQSVVASETSLTLKVNEQKTLSATVLPQNASCVAVVFSSSNETILKVDKYNGTVTALKEGNANVIVSSVEGAKTTVIPVTISGSLTPLTQGYTQKLSDTFNSASTWIQSSSVIKPAKSAAFFEWIRDSLGEVTLTTANKYYLGSNFIVDFVFSERSSLTPGDTSSWAKTTVGNLEVVLYGSATVIELKQNGVSLCKTKVLNPRTDIADRYTLKVMGNKAEVYRNNELFLQTDIKEELLNENVKFTSYIASAGYLDEVNIYKKDVLTGDSNLDSEVDIFDLITLAKGIVSSDFSACALENSDIDQNTNIDIFDLIGLAKKIVS